MLKATVTGVLLLVAGGSLHAAQVWQSTFDTGPDGVVDVVDGNPDKALIGPATAGRLQILTQDKAAAHNNNDRGGRALGATLSGNDSFSGLYEFRFADLNEDASPQMWEFVGFIGDNVNVTRQTAGVMMRHWKVGENYYTSMDMVYGEAGTGAHFFDAGGGNGYGPFSPTAILLGAGGEGRDLKLAIGYDGSSHVLTAELYDGGGVLMSGNTADLDTVLVPNGSNTVQTMLDALAVTHLGWADYVATGNGRTTEWSVDRLSYFDDPDGAFAAAVPEPGAAIALLSMGAMLLRRRV